MKSSNNLCNHECVCNKELTAAILLLAKKITAINDPASEETMESIIDEYNEFLLMS